MKYIQQRLAAAVLMVGVLVAGGAQAQEPSPWDKYFSMVLGGSIQWSATDGCWHRSVHVTGFSGMSHVKGAPPTRGDELFLDYSSYNTCTGEWLNGSGFTDAETVRGTLSELTLRGTVKVLERPSGVERTAVVDLTFESTRDSVSRSVSHDIYSTPVFRVHARGKVINMSAEVSGGISLEGMDLLEGLETEYAYVFDGHSAEVKIYRK